jgi:multidrug efflux pump subunit AcrA (membrane-fusion protein)
MKPKTLLLVLLVAAAGATAVWFAAWRQPAPAATAPAAAAGRKILYYQSSMHPWIKSDKPGKCPICGMDLVPIYESTESTNTGFGLKLNSDSVNVANVQTAPVQRRQLVHTLRVAGAIEMASHPTWFVFNAYERDFVWLDVGQTVEVTIPALPGKIYKAKITHIDTRFLDSNRNDQTHGIQVRATVSENLAHVEGVKLWRPFDGFYAEGRVLVNSPDVLAIPRNAVLQPGQQPVVYVDEANGNYQQRKVKLGRVGDEFVEILDGLKEGEKIVTSGGLLIDAEAQISKSAQN